MQIRELHLDCMSELSFSSLGACVKIQNISREGKAQAAKLDGRQTSGGLGALLVFEQNFKISSCKESNRDERGREM